MSDTENQEPVDPEIVSAEKWARSNPNNLPTQFGGDPEKFLASYKEMRATLTRTQQELASTKKEPPKESTPEPVADATPAPVVSALTIPEKTAEPSVDEWEIWGKEIQTTGNLSAETRAKIMKTHNLPASVIDAQVAGFHAQVKQGVEEAAKVVGSPEDLNNIVKWAQENLPDAERNAVNAALQRPGWQTTLIGLKTRMEAQNPEPKKKVNTVNGVAPGLKPFASSKEMTTALRDPRYKFDSAYQELVQDRIRISGTMKHDNGR